MRPLIHIAILKPGYIDAILTGRKTVESRLTKTMQPPHGQVMPGEQLFLKASGGPYLATAIAGEVLSFTNMTPGDVDRLRSRHGQAIAGDNDYWQSKRASRFATLIELLEVEPIAVGPTYKVAYMKAWYVLDEALSPLRDWRITVGAIRNRYAMLPLDRDSNKKPGTRLSLLMPDGSQVTTDLARGRMLRWRGWGPVYDAFNAKPGDVLRFIALGQERFEVRFIRA